LGKLPTNGRNERADEQSAPRAVGQATNERKERGSKLMSDPTEEPSGKLLSGPTSNPSGEATGNLSGKLPTSGRDEQRVNK
jgi:hypothetical protein